MPKIKAVNEETKQKFAKSIAAGIELAIATVEDPRINLTVRLQALDLLLTVARDLDR